MEFEVFPKSGFVGTQFGFKVIDQTSSDRYRYEFGDDEGSTDWIEGKTFVYRTFESPGGKRVRMETESGVVVEREVLVRDARQFGTGKVVGADFVPGTRYLVLKLSNGIETYHLDDLQGLFLEIDYDEIHPINHRRVFVTWKDGKRVGILDLETGRFVEEREGVPIHVFPDEHLALIVAKGRVEVFDYLRWEIRGSVEGEHVTTSKDHRRILYRHDDLYHLYEIDSWGSVEVGAFESKKHLPEFDEYIELKRDGKEYVYWTDSGETWKLSLLDEEGETRSELGDLIDIPGEGTCIRVRRELPYGRLFLRLLPSEGRRVVERFGDPHVVVQDSSPDLIHKLLKSESDTKGEFVGFLHGGEFYQREQGEGYEILEISTEDVVLRSPEKVGFVFDYDGRSVAVVNTDETTTLINVDDGSTIVQHEGEFKEGWVPLLRDRGQLWVRHSLPRNRYTVYDGISDLEGIELDVDSVEGEFVVSREGIRGVRDLSDLRTFDGKLRKISEGGRHVVVEQDGHVVLHRDFWSDEHIMHELRVADGTYKNVEFSPDGKFLALGKSGETEILDLNTFETVKVLDADFVRYNPDGRILCAETVNFYPETGHAKSWARPRIFDPATFEQVEPDRLVDYSFVSKDGKYGASLGVLPHFSVYKAGVSPHLLIKTRETYPDPSNHRYTNFVVLHPLSDDSLLIAVAGCLENFLGGRVRVLEGVFEGDRQNWKSASLHAGKAVWKCLVSNDGNHLAFYDSAPRTYVYSLPTLDYEEGVE